MAKRRVAIRGRWIVAAVLIGFVITTSDGFEQPIGTDFKWVPHQWHHVAATWGDTIMSLYIDAELRTERELNGTLQIPPGTPMYVGSTHDVLKRKTQGTVSLRSWQVFPVALTAEDINTLIEQTQPPPAH